jgi:hypothetical protein
MAAELRASACYVGQRVFWVMWCDPSDKRIGWYGYKPGFSPEIWSSSVQRLPGNGSIVLEHYGRAANIYSCEIAAVRRAYQLFCQLYLEPRGVRGMCPLGEASRVLRELAELEFGIHVSHSIGCKNGR